MYYVLNTGCELSGAQKGRNFQTASWSLQSKIYHCKTQRNRKDKRFAGSLQQSTIFNNLFNSEQCCSPLNSLRAFLLCLFSWDGTPAKGMEASGSAAHLGGHLPPLLAPHLSELQLCSSTAENRASSAWCWWGFGNFAVWRKNVVMSDL